MVRPGRDRLRGDVEVDESYLGGPEPGIPGRGALGKVLFAGAVERNPGRFGRALLGIIPDASAAMPRRVPSSRSRAWQPRHRRRLAGLPGGHP